MVLKPSPECPFSALFIALACAEAGVPPGVVNVVIGPEVEIGEELLYSPVVRKIGFTGSTEVGKYLYAQSAQTLKKLTLELGGHAPVIIHDDADLDLAADPEAVAAVISSLPVDTRHFGVNDRPATKARASIEAAGSLLRSRRPVGRAA